MGEKIVWKGEVTYQDKEKPALGRAYMGQVILTNQRFIYAKFQTGFLNKPKHDDYSEKIDEGLKNEGSFEVPLKQIVDATAIPYHGTSYLSLRYKQASGEKACTFQLFVGKHGGLLAWQQEIKKGGSVIVQLAKTINQLRKA
jgi:hypothetical protein